MSTGFTTEVRGKGRRMSKARRAAFALPVLVSLVMSGGGAVGAADKPTDEVARNIVARRTGASTASLTVLESSTAQYPLQKKTARVVKVLDQRSGQIHGVALDPTGRQEVNIAALEAAEDAGRGRLHPALSERLARTGPGDKVPVLIWLKEQSSPGPDRPAADASEEQVEAYLKAVDEHRAAEVAKVTGPALARLRSQGYAPEADTYTPIVTVDVPAAAVRGISEAADVDQVYLANTNEAELDVARQTIRANSVNGAGFSGTGVNLGVIEVGGRFAAGNPNLSGAVQDTTSVCAGASGHTTAVAGMVRSTHGTHRGIAPASNLRVGGSCGGVSSELQARSTAAADWGARALNLSWGSDIGLVPGANDRFYDNLAMNRARTVVKSAGNVGASGCPSGSSGNVTSPGLAYNILTVGNFDDRNTVGWSDDLMNNCSSWRDPSSTNGDREKPDLSAPGTNINSTTTAWPWTGGTGSGTSYAAPMVTGTVGLLMQKSPALQSWPESVRAIMQATATHNIEGATRLSEFDGAGGIDALRAYYAAARIASSGWGGRSYDCSAAQHTTLGSASLTAGRKARVAMAWDNDPSYASYASRPSADLDLQIVNSAGTVVAGSSSWDNTFEIVDFTPATTGTYTIRVNKYRCDLSPRYLGWAWSNA